MSLPVFRFVVLLLFVVGWTSVNFCCVELGQLEVCGVPCFK